MTSLFRALNKFFNIKNRSAEYFDVLKHAALLKCEVTFKNVGENQFCAYKQFYTQRNYDNKTNEEKIITVDVRRSVVIPVPVGPVTYGIAMHELGHIATTPGSQLNTRDYHLLIENEQKAWEWARKNAILEFGD